MDRPEGWSDDFLCAPEPTWRTYDPVHHVLRVDADMMFEADHWGQYGALASVVKPDGRVLDYGLDLQEILLLLTLGPDLLEGLAGVAPYPMVTEDDVDAGIVLDQVRRQIRFWTRENASPACIADLSERWPGWELKREPLAFAGHLHATGRTGEGLIWGNGLPWPALYEKLHPEVLVRSPPARPCAYLPAVEETSQGLAG